MADAVRKIKNTPPGESGISASHNPTWGAVFCSAPEQGAREHNAKVVKCCLTCARVMLDWPLASKPCESSNNIVAQE
eukprot:1034803-Amphidinium_carterae.1